MEIIIESRIGKRRGLFIPKRVAEAVKTGEGQRVRIIVNDDRVIIKPLEMPYG